MSLNKQAGLSLVELMVALLISSILLLGVLELFGSSSQSSRSANALARLQENGRLAMDLIAREARRSGFNGCDGGISASVPVQYFDVPNLDYPNDAIAPAQGEPRRRVTFRYLGNGDGVSDTNCKQADLLSDNADKGYTISFFNQGGNLRVKSSTRGEQTLLNHATIESVHYIQPCKPDDPTDKNTCSYEETYFSATSPPRSYKDVQKIQIVLKICTDTLSETNTTKYCASDSTTKLERTFSSLIELRNRL